jgi:hypothetical protein
MNKRYFKCPNKLELIEISSRDICRQARFIPDDPFVLEADQLLTLTNGEFFIGEKKIEGHWADLRVQQKPTTGAKL